MTESQPSFAERLRRGDTLIGSMVTLRSAEVAELIAGCGFDWLFIDAEHGPFGPGDALPLLQGADPCPCLVRVPPDPLWVKKALDVGAAGVILPQIHDAVQARPLVAAAKYPPEGDRGLGVGRAHAYGRTYEEYLKSANRTTAVVVQAETRGAVEDIESIVAIDGVDAVLIGPNDLSTSLGHPGELTHPEVMEAVDTVVAACSAAGIKLGTFGVTPEAVRPYRAKGCTLLTLGVDTLFLGQAAAAAASELRGG